MGWKKLYPARPQLRSPEDLGFHHFLNTREASQRDEPGEEPTSHLLAAHGCEDALVAPGGSWVAPARRPQEPLGREMRRPGTRQSMLPQRRGCLASRLRSLLSNRPAQVPFPVICCSWDSTRELAVHSRGRHFPGRWVAPEPACCVSSGCVNSWRRWVLFLLPWGVNTLGLLTGHFCTLLT